MVQWKFFLQKWGVESLLNLSLLGIKQIIEKS